MDSHRVDRVAKTMANRISRRNALASSSGLGMAMLGARSRKTVNAQDASPEASPAATPGSARTAEITFVVREGKVLELDGEVVYYGKTGRSPEAVELTKSQFNRLIAACGVQVLCIQAVVGVLLIECRDYKDSDHCWFCDQFEDPDANMDCSDLWAGLPV